MDQTRWLRQVENRLLKAGLPARYVTRACLELSDHVETCREAGKEVSLLREPTRDLSTQLVRGYRRKGVWRRIPPALLLLLPLPIAVLIALAYYQVCYVVLVLLFDPFDCPGELPLQVATTMWAFFYGGKMAVPLLGGLAMREIARRMARPWGWAAAIFALQGWATALVVTSLELAPAEIDLNIDLNFVWPHLLGSVQLLSGLAIATLGFWVVTRLRYEQHRMTI